MKKFIFAFIFATMLTMSIASCNCGSNSDAVDSTATDTVLVDSFAVDSAVIDSVAIDSIVAE
jgi:hypothetical protein